MSRNPPVDFFERVPPELYDVDLILSEFARWSSGGQRVEKSAVVGNFRPQRPDEEKQEGESKGPKIPDWQATNINRVLTCMPVNPTDWLGILRSHYVWWRYGHPQVMCRKLKGVRAQTWVQERNKALHMFKNIYARGIPKAPRIVYTAHTYAQECSDAIAD